MYSRNCNNKSNLLEGLETRRLMANFVVANTNDSGTGSLRAAITSANATPAADTITFAIAASSKMISPLTDLPAITSPLTIDGTSQAGYSDRPLVELRGSSVVASQGGLRINAADTTVKGLSITGFNGSAIKVAAGATNAQIRDNHLGVVAFGNVAWGNALYGVHTQADGTVIDHNLLSANAQAGVFFDHVNGGSVTRNVIGATRDGNVELGAQLHGIYGQTSNNIIVGSMDDVALGNVIMGDQNSIRALSCEIWEVAGNTIGMNAAKTVQYPATSAQISTASCIGWSIGSASAANFIAGTGIYLQDGDEMNVSYNVIGTDISQTLDFGGDFGVWGSSATLCTVRSNIVGNQLTGVAFTNNSDQNHILSNFIGVSTNTSQWLGNQVGVNIAGSYNDVGLPGQQNTIAHNHSKGVVISSGVENTIISRVFSNGLINIDLGNDGATANDGMSDTDTGANNLMNAPYVLFANAMPNGHTSVNVGLQTVPGQYRVDIYSSSWPDSAGKGSGESLMTSMNVNVTNPNGWQQTIDFTQHVPAGYYISAVATKLGTGPTGNTMLDTSEFSYAEQVWGNPEVVGSSFQYEYYHRFEFQFSANVWNSLQNSDVVFTNLESGQTFTPDGAYVDPTNKIWSPNFSTPLPDGNYTATIAKNNVYDTLGRPLVADYTMNFFVLAGDFNRDRTVNFDDLLTLSQNYGKTVQKFSTGDANYDQKIDFSDLLIVSQNYGDVLSAPVMSATTTRRTRFDLSSLLD